MTKVALTRSIGFGQGPVPLPTTWKMLPLGVLADARLGKMLDAAKNTGTPHPYLRNPNVRWMDIDLSDLKEMPFEPHEEAKFSIKDGDVLVCEGGEAGRAAIWHGPDIGVKFQKAIHRVRCGPDLHNRYLVHKLMHDYFSGDLSDYTTGATIKHITGQDLARYKIPLPPLDEQRRIAAILDQADALRRKRREQLSYLGILSHSKFQEMFGDPIGKTARYPSSELASLIDPARPITYGILKPGPDVPDGVPYVRVVDIKAGRVLVRQLRRTAPGISNQYKRSTIRAGDLLISIRGHVGRMAFAPEEITGSNITQDTARLAIVEANPVFVRAVLENPLSVRWMAERTRGIAVQGINLGDLKKFPVISPPREDQDAFAEIIAGIETLRSAAERQLSDLDALFASLQHRAFRGEL